MRNSLVQRGLIVLVLVLAMAVWFSGTVALEGTAVCCTIMLTTGQPV